jgi:trigger factor
MTDNEADAPVQQDEAVLDSPQDSQDEGAETQEAKPKLDLDVQITDTGPCKKHLKISISAQDVEREFDEALVSFRKDALVPGFRPGRAPRILVQKRFKKEVAGQVKSNLLMACMEQLDAEYKLNPISQPDLDLEAIELPEEGPLKFELDVEVHPEFDLPDFKGLSIKRPVRQVTPADVDRQLKSFLESYAQLVPKSKGEAELGDYVTADIVFHKGGVLLNRWNEVQFRLQPELRFRDGKVPNLGSILAGARPGDVRDADAQIGSSSPDPAIRNQTIQITFHVHDLKHLRLPELSSEFLDSIGFENENDLREELKRLVARRFAFRQRQSLRKQVFDILLDRVKFDLPPELVKRQELSTMRRIVEEMRHAGMSDSDIRAREAEIRANAHEQTLRSLKEFFLLSRIAEAEGIKVEDEDVELEINRIAEQEDESPRRIRARIEKEGLAESLVTQILERKSLDHILECAQIEDVALEEEEKAVETLEETAAVASESSDENETQGSDASPDSSSADS